MSRPSPAGGLDLEQIAARLKAATPMPWSPFMGSGLNQCTALMHETVNGQLHFVADFCPDYVLEPTTERMERSDHIPDMAFVEHAPEDIAALLREVEALRTALRPFALAGDTGKVTVGDLRRAAAVLGAPERDL